MQAHSIVADRHMKFLNAIIYLEEIIRKYENAEHFFLKIKLMQNDESELDQHTFSLMKVLYCSTAKSSNDYLPSTFYCDFPQKLKKHLIEMRLKHLIASGDKAKILNKTQRGQVIRETANMMVVECSMFPKKIDYEKFSAALHHFLPKWLEVISIPILKCLQHYSLH